MSIFISIIISISILIYISIFIIIFSVVVNYPGGEEPELMGSVLELFIWYKRNRLQLDLEISTTKGTNWIFQRRHSLGRGKSRSHIFFLFLRGRQNFKCWAGACMEKGFPSREAFSHHSYHMISFRLTHDVTQFLNCMHK